MASFLSLLDDLRRGGTTVEVVIESLIHDLRVGTVEPDELLEQLDRQQTDSPLPIEVFVTIKRQIHVTKTSLGIGAGADERTRMMASGGTEQATAPTVGVGDILNDRFILEELIARGGMSLVYRAIDKRDLEMKARNAHVAVKVMNVVGHRRVDAIMALHREAQKCKSMRHPNIVGVYDFNRDGETIYITMEYLRGENLAKKIAAAGQGHPLPEALALIKQMGEALAYAHGRGIIHADFKPGNVIVTPKGEAKVIDFGIARAYRGAPDATATKDQTVFDARALGAMTLGYASPEMIDDQEPDPRDDVYALGCVAYELLGGRHPWAGASAAQARTGGMVLRKPDEMDGTRWLAVKRALAFDRDARTPSVQQFLEDLTREQPPPPVRRPPAIKVPEWKLPTLKLPKAKLPTWGPQASKIAGIGGLVVLVGAAAWWLYDRLPTAGESADIIQDCEACPRLAVVAAGVATVGALPGPGVFSFESPAHSVTIAAPFAMAEHETTVDEFRAFAEDVGFDARRCRAVENGWLASDALSWRNPGFKQEGDHPVTCVSWNDAVAYTTWLSKKTGASYRLPTEAEWEYAARADGGLAARTKGGDVCSQANVADQSALRVYPGLTVASCDDGFAQTSAAAFGAKQAFGLLGMHGNVFEWTQDCWNRSYKDAPTDGRAWATGNCKKRVLRGGSWFTAPGEQRATFRNRFDADYRGNTFGFRVVKELE